MNSGLIADRIEEIIGRMFVDFRTLDTGATEYSIFYNPLKNKYWIILIFFEDIDKLRESFKNGICYQIYTFLVDQLDLVEETSSIHRMIFFESGKRPIEEIDIDNLFEKLLVKIKSLQKVEGKTNNKICGSCGHDFDKHQLLFNNESGKINTTTEGWIMCPEENCNCFQTWSANYKNAVEIKNEGKENKLKQTLKRLFK